MARRVSVQSMPGAPYKMLPTATFIMRGIAYFAHSGKWIAAHLPDIERSASRLPSLCGNDRGDEWEASVADELGPLTH